MRTSAGGRQLPDWNPDMWEHKSSGPSSDTYECRVCGSIHYDIRNPSPNTIGGKRRMRMHQTGHPGGVSADE